MTRLAELHDCDGFEVESPEGPLGVVEETWHDERGRPVALAVRTTDGRRQLLPADTVRDVDADAREVLVASGARLADLEWRPPLEAGDAAAVVAPTADPHERPVWLTIALMLGCLTTLIAFEIGLAFGLAYLVAGHAY